MRTILLILLSVTILWRVSIGNDDIGSDASGPWMIEVRTNMIFRGSSRQIIETVVTNRVTQSEYQHLQKVAAEAKHWREQVALVHVGMRRDEVEKLLPPCTQPVIGLGKGYGYELHYWLDEHWGIAMWYDNTDSQPGSDGKILPSSMVANKLLFRPYLHEKQNAQQHHSIETLDLTIRSRQPTH